METVRDPRPARGATVRSARPADAPAIEEVRVAGWQSAYRGIVDDAYLDAMRPDPDRFAEPLRDQTAVAHYVAQSGGEVVGWACLGPCRDADAPEAAREVYACYVRPAWWRCGVGRELLRAALAPVPGTAAVLLWVLRDNAAARAFYERQGFAPDGAERGFAPAGPGPAHLPLPEVRYLRAAREAA